MAEMEQELRDILTEEASRMSFIGDTSWRADLDELVRLYDRREENTNEFWLTPPGSAQRENYDNHNAVYINALLLWDKTWKLVIGHHNKGKFVSYQVVSDFLKMKSMEFEE